MSGTIRAMRRRFLKQVGGAGAALLAAQRVFAEDVGWPGLARAEGTGYKPVLQAAMDFRRLRNEYLLDRNVTYLNHGSIGTIPRAVHEAHLRYLKLCESNPWLYMWGDAWEEPREEVRKRAAWLLRCATDEIAFTHNTTEAFNLLAHGLPLGPGDEVLFSSLNHTGASAAWQHMSAQRGFTVKRFDFPVAEVPVISAERVVEIYAAQISPRTRVLVIPHIDNTVGLRYPLIAMARMAQEKGVMVAVDAAQAVGMIPVDVPATGVGVYATSPHKWLQAPKGTGLLYVRKDVQEMLRPMWVTWGQAQWKGTARIYEDYGTRNLAEVLTLGDAIAFLAQIPHETREARLKGLWAVTRAEADKAGVAWRSPNDWELGSALATVDAPAGDSRELEKRLYQEHGVVTRAFHTMGLNSIRLSPNVFTREEEIAKYFELAGKVAERG